MNITPIDTLAANARESLVLHGPETYEVVERVRKHNAKIIATAIRQALREREKFMGHASPCHHWSHVNLPNVYPEDGCSCGFSEVQKEMK